MKNLIGEIHRRSLWQVLGIYAAASWVVLQIVDTLAGALGLPEWSASLALFLLIIGLPIVLATAFLQQGMKTKEPESPAESLADAGEVPPAPPIAPGGAAALPDEVGELVWVDGSLTPLFNEPRLPELIGAWLAARGGAR